MRHHKKRYGDVFHIGQISNPQSGSLPQARIQRETGYTSCVTKGFRSARSKVKGVEDMFGIIAAVLIVLWLLGLLAFHVSSGFIHILLVIGIVMLLLHFFRGRSATA
jgi:hypothetical protein